MHKIVIAEDDKNIRANLSDFLCSEGYLVFPAENGLNAFILSKTIMPDLIISDLHMPVMDGFALLKKLRDTPVTSPIPLIFITSDTDFVDAMKGVTSGVIACLSKPFYFNELLNIINDYKLKHEA